MTETIAPAHRKSMDMALITLGLLLIIVSVYSIWSTTYLGKSRVLPSGKIIQCFGVCKYKSPDDFFWLNATSDLAVLDKSMVFTPDNSTASILLSSGSKLTLYPNSLVQITTTKKGSTIDIIEGKINFDEVNKTAGDKITIKGEEIKKDDITVTQNEVTEISVIPEKLDVDSPEMVYLKVLPTSFMMEVNNGKPPYKAYLEAEGLSLQEQSATSTISMSVSRPGHYTLRIEDSLGDTVTKLVDVADLVAPVIRTPRNGDYLYTKTFMPVVDGLASGMEFGLKQNGELIYQGGPSEFPKNLKKGEYTLAARKFSGQIKGEWSSEIRFQLVDTKRPMIITKNDAVFFNQAKLQWHRSLPVPHILRITNSDSDKSTQLSLTEEEFLFQPEKTGRFTWSVRPMVDDNFDEKVLEGKFTVIETSRMLLAPKENEQITSDDLEKEVAFEWKPLPVDDVEVQLEISDRKDKKLFDVSGNSSYSLDLRPLGQYSWRLNLAIGPIKVSTPSQSFGVVPPPAVEPIKENEIIIKD